MSQVLRADTPWSIQTSLPGRQTLAPELVESGVVRLCWLCLICAVPVTISLLLQSILQPETRSLMWTPAAWVWISILLISVGMAFVRRFHVISSLNILRLGLVFEVLVAFGISFYETGLPLDPGHPVVRGTGDIVRGGNQVTPAIQHG